MAIPERARPALTLLLGLLSAFVASCAGSGSSSASDAAAPGPTTKLEAVLPAHCTIDGGTGTTDGGSPSSMMSDCVQEGRPIVVQCKATTIDEVKLEGPALLVTKLCTYQGVSVGSGSNGYCCVSGR